MPESLHLTTLLNLKFRQSQIRFFYLHCLNTTFQYGTLNYQTILSKLQQTIQTPEYTLLSSYHVNYVITQSLFIHISIVNEIHSSGFSLRHTTSV